MYHWFLVNSSTGAIGYSSATLPPDDTLIPSGFTMLGPYTALDTEQQAVAVSPQAYLYQGGAFTSNPAWPAQQLTQAQAAQLAILTTGYNATLTGGFTSSATGAAVTYGSSAADYTNMTELLTSNSAGIATWPFPWQLPSGNVVDLTQAQFTQLCKDAQAWKVAQINQLRSLAGQVQAATSVSAVLDILWTPAVPA